MSYVGPLLFATRFQGKELALPGLEQTACVADLKQLLQDETAVPCKRQKLIGLVKGKLPEDSARLSEMSFKGAPPFRFTLMGTPDDMLFVDPCDRGDLPEVFDDFDTDYAALSDQWHRSRRNAQQLAKFTDKTEINWITPHRPGKRLLVLDLDHTLLDFDRNDESPARQAKRPHLDAFLASAYPEYDLVVWSQTSWLWLEVKLTELGLLSNARYKICFVLDKTSMFSIVSTKRDGSQFKHQVKPLQLIWSKFAFWSRANTLHVDDLSRNFALNPTSGIKCRAYHRRDPDAAQDAELPLISAYLQHLARLEDVGRVDHANWRSELKRLHSKHAANAQSADEQAAPDDDQPSAT